jgi:osmotically inducible protein OsmC
MARWLPVALLSLLPGMGFWEADVPPASLTGYQNGDSLHQTLLKEIAMAEKHASVHWDGAGKAGTGKISTETGALKDYPYGFASRFGDDRHGTNPEEILGAAHAACFTMAFSFACDSHGIATKSIDTTAAVRLVPQGSGFAIDRIALTLKAAVPGIDDATFQKIANGAKENCPLSKALTGVPEITLVATLVS